ncbi:MAG: AMP-binding protein [Clostridia bacterium]|nr:AMP-binding protein [Clostridia bacterium]
MKTYNEKRFNNYREIVNNCAKQYGEKTAFIVRNADKSKTLINFGTFADHYYRLCTYFINQGWQGKRIAVCGKNCYEWIVSYLAASTVGVVVPIDKEVSKEDVLNFINAAECVAACTEKVVEDPDGKCINILFKEVREIVQSDAPIDKPSVDAIEIPKDKMQILIFTSGTTGSSKGVCLSQYNICTNIWQTSSIVKIVPDDQVLSILPLHHTYECSFDHLLILSKGATVTYADSLTKIAANITEYKPTVLVVVPALLKLLDKRIKKAIAADCPKRYKKYYEELTLAEALAKTPFPIRYIIKNKVRKTLGGNMRMMIVGAADLDTYLVDDFAALGIRTLQGYGLTECSPLLAGNNDFYLNKASTGIAIPGVQLKIDNPNEEGVGEIIAKGENIMLGYFNDPEATAKVFRDGWFCTGDLGYMAEDGALFIKGRIKNVIVTENGKNIYPEELETRLSEYPEVGESIVVPATKDGVVEVKAKILPNIDYLKEKLGHMPSKEECVEAIHNAVKQVNEKIPRYKHITIIETLEEALEKTTTQKIRRFGKNVK